MHCESEAFVQVTADVQSVTTLQSSTTQHQPIHSQTLRPTVTPHPGKSPGSHLGHATCRPRKKNTGSRCHWCTSQQQCSCRFVHTLVSRRRNVRVTPTHNGLRTCANVGLAAGVLPEPNGAVLALGVACVRTRRHSGAVGDGLTRCSNNNRSALRRRPRGGLTNAEPRALIAVLSFRTAVADRVSCVRAGHTRRATGHIRAAWRHLLREDNANGTSKEPSPGQAPDSK